MKPPPARPCTAAADNPAWHSALWNTWRLLALIVILCGLLGAVYTHGPALAEEAPDAPSASLYALTPTAIIRDATHVAIVAERSLGATVVLKASTPALPIEPASATQALAPLTHRPPPAATGLLGIVPTSALARGPPWQRAT